MQWSYVAKFQFFILFILATRMEEKENDEQDVKSENFLLFHDEVKCMRERRVCRWKKMFLNIIA